MISFAVAHAAQPAALQGLDQVPGVYPLLPATAAYVAGGGTQDVVANIANILKFQILGFTGRVWVDGAPETAIADPALTVAVQLANGAFITKGGNPVLWGSLVETPASGNVGTGGLPAPVLIGGQEQLTVTVASYALVATHYWFEIDMVGISIYDRLPAAS